MRAGVYIGELPCRHTFQISVFVLGPTYCELGVILLIPHQKISSILKTKTY